MRSVILVVLLLAACASPQLPRSVLSYDETTSCAVAPETSPICLEDVSTITEADARAALGEREFVYERDGNRLTVYTRTETEGPIVCCSLQAPMTRIGDSNLYVTHFRLERLDEASLMFMSPSLLSAGRFDASLVQRFIGPSAPAQPPVVEALRGQILQRTLWSEHLRETRRLYIYLPPDYDRARRYPVLFIADGSSVEGYAPIIERLIDDRRIAPIIVVGSESGQEGIVEDRADLGIEDIRSADYLPRYPEGGARFEQHLRFFSEELIAYAAREFNTSSNRHERAVAGFSNGATFSLYAALRRPDVFGASLSISPGWEWLTETDLVRRPRSRFFITGGLYEIRRSSRATQYAEVLRSHGYDAALDTPVTGHDFFQEGMALMLYLPAIFPPSTR